MLAPDKRFVYYLESLGYIQPTRVPKRRIDRRDYSASDVERIRGLWRYYQRGYALQAAQELAARPRHGAYALLQLPSREQPAACAALAALPPVRAAPDRLVQVFLNLILNAADAGGNLTIRAVRARNAICVIFEDKGRGMTSEEMRRIFDPFHSTKDNETHLGLGLFVSHEIVRQHGGDLLAESQPGVGATFTVILPMQELSSMSEEPA